MSYPDVLLAVAGAHLSGQPLNSQLIDRGAELVAPARTAPEYRLFLLPTTPPKPGVVRVREGGVSLELELWRLTAAAFGDFVSSLPSPMAIGSVVRDDGSEVRGFLVEPFATEGAEDISSFGGWRAFRAARG